MKCYYKFRRPLRSKNRISKGETMSSFYPTVCDAVSGIEWVVGFLFNSIKAFFRQSFRANTIFMKIDAEAVLLYVRVRREFCLHLPSFMIDLRKFSVRNLHSRSLSRCYFLKKKSALWKKCSTDFCIFPDPDKVACKGRPRKNCCITVSFLNVSAPNRVSEIFIHTFQIYYQIWVQFF